MNPVADVAIEATGLTVRYGSLEAVSEVDLSVRAGEVVALLGPNGAGKSTCVETLLGYRRPDAGTASVLGCDPVTDHARLVHRVGAMLQRGGVWPSMAVRDVLSLFASYYDAPEDTELLIDRLELSRCATTPWRRLSGGEEQRCSLAIALLPRPDALFLDEPTAGVDPVGRKVIREVIADERSRGTAVLVCTHDLADVEAVCDAAVVLHRGRVRASGAVSALTSGGTTFTSMPGLDVPALAAALEVPVVEVAPGTYRTERALDAQGAAALATHLDAVGAPLDALRHGATLEDAYLSIVGVAAIAAEPPPPGRGRRRR